MNIQEVAECCHGQIVNCKKPAKTEVEGGVVDSRLVKDKNIFFASKGAKVDGHDYINKAFSMGASVCVCERVPDDVKKPCIVVPDTMTALADIAAYYLGTLSCKVVGITGSVGKTTTKEFIAAILSAKYNVIKTQKNFNNEVGLPLTVLSIRPEHEVAVLEMGIADFGQMRFLANIARPDVEVITNIGTCHLERLGDRDGVFKAKTEMFDYLQVDGSVCLFYDDDKLCQVKEVDGKPPVFFGFGEGADIRATDVKSFGLKGSSAKVTGPDFDMNIRVNLPGKHMINDALAAIAVARCLGLNSYEIIEGLKNVESLEGRSHIILGEKYTIIDDVYNANPASMRAALDMLSLADTRKVAILGDMFELGEKEVEYHEEIGTYAVDKCDVLVAIGKLSYNMALKAKAAVKIPIYHYDTKEEFMESMGEILKDGDSILLKASHGMDFKAILDKLIA